MQLKYLHLLIEDKKPLPQQKDTYILRDYNTCRIEGRPARQTVLQMIESDFGYDADTIKAAVTVATTLAHPKSTPAALKICCGLLPEASKLLSDLREPQSQQAPKLQ